MALQKEFITNLGVAGNYWKILSFEDNRISGKTDVIVGLYLSKAARNADKDKLSRKVYTLDSFDVSNKSHLQYVYDYLKTLPEFSGAIDC